MKFPLILGLAIVLVTCFLVSDMMSASAQSSRSYGCTAGNPCNYQVCGDHVCAPGEFAQLQAQNSQAQMGNNTSITTQNMTTTGQSTGTILAGVVTYEDMASDGTLVIVRTGLPITGQPLSVGIGFFGSNRNAISNQNYAITISQDNNIVLSKSNANANSGIDTLTTAPLPSSNPINIQVTLNGVGSSTTDPSTWTGARGVVLGFSQGPLATTTSNMTVTTPNMTATTPASNNSTVPEFGPVASVVLAMAVISVVVIAAKTRVIRRL